MSTLLPVLTAYEKEHISERQPLPERYLGLSDEEMNARIAAAKTALGRRLVILGHHYQRDEVITFADYTGDSPSRGRSAKSGRPIVFARRFMAERGRAGAAHQQVYPAGSRGRLLHGGHGRHRSAEMCWNDLGQMGVCACSVTYISSAVTVKAFVGEHGQVVRPRTRRRRRWAWERAIAFSFCRISTSAATLRMGVQQTRWSSGIERDLGRRRCRRGKRSRMILWKGHCSVHTFYSPANREHRKVSRRARDRASRSALDVVRRLTILGLPVHHQPGDAVRGVHLGGRHRIHLVNRLARQLQRTHRCRSPVRLPLLDHVPCLAESSLWVLEGSWTAGAQPHRRAGRPSTGRRSRSPDAHDSMTKRFARRKEDLR